MATKDASIYVRFLGSFTIIFPDMSELAPSGKEGEILAYLLYRRPGPLSPTQLSEAARLGDDPDKARHRLHWMLSRAHSRVKPFLHGLDLFGFSLGAYRLNPVLEIESDIVFFRTLRRECTEESLRRAVRLCVGDFCAGYSADWVLDARVGVRMEIEDVQGRIAALAGKRGDFAEMHVVARAAFEADHANEQAAMLEMIAAVGLGQLRGAFEAYREHERCLKGDFEAAPSPRILALRREIASAAHDAGELLAKFVLPTSG